MAELKQLARQIFLETLQAIDIPATMQRKMRCEEKCVYLDERRIELKEFSRACVVAVGKAAHGMVEGLVRILPEGMEVCGVVSAPTAPERRRKGLEYFRGGHPVPNEESLNAARAVLHLLRECDEKAVVFFLVSGGGSALMELPLDAEQTLEGVQQLHRALVTCGAPIGEINAVRKHLSAVKGGRLAAAAGRATKITLAISDVPQGRESALASGPTLPDPTTVADAETVLAKHQLKAKLPKPVREWIEAGKMIETPKSGDAAFANAHWCLLLGMDDLFHPAHRAAEAKGIVTRCDNTTDDWPVEKAAEELLRQLEEMKRIHLGHWVALIADGEVSSPVTGNGVGGRNSAFVLACVEKMAGKKVAVLSAGTDGIDGNSPAAGAVADGETLMRARAGGLDPRAAFRNSDAYAFFEKLGDAVMTGPTGNNLRDLRILLAE
jgi:glycerate 2-kinase